MYTCEDKRAGKAPWLLLSGLLLEKERKTENIEKDFPAPSTTRLEERTVETLQCPRTFTVDELSEAPTYYCPQWSLSGP
ncbi:hypothetical protein LDENG_00211760 [Lucifuga dentata]|nr:hypothetical protein LDENG_00211760 [Lucifuga dentata]